MHTGSRAPRIELSADYANGCKHPSYGTGPSGHTEQTKGHECYIHNLHTSLVCTSKDATHRVPKYKNPNKQHSLSKHYKKMGRPLTRPQYEPYHETKTFNATIKKKSTVCTACLEDSGFLETCVPCGHQLYCRSCYHHKTECGQCWKAIIHEESPIHKEILSFHTEQLPEWCLAARTGGRKIIGPKEVTPPEPPPTLSVSCEMLGARTSGSASSHKCCRVLPCGEAALRTIAPLHPTLAPLLLRRMSWEERTKRGGMHGELSRQKLTQGHRPPAQWQPGPPHRMPSR